MVHVRLFGRVFEIDLSSPGTPPRYWCHGRWVSDPSLRNEDVLFDAQSRAVPRTAIRTLIERDRVGAA
jgi:hypothetical protein